MLGLIFRYDDFSAAERQSRETDSAVFELFRTLDMPLVVGVTPRMSKSVRDARNEVFYPFEEDMQRVALLRQGLARGWQLALHGYTHQRTAAVDGTEFAHEPREVQLAKIQNGLAILHRCFPETPVDVFIPPWNSFDQTTLECVAEAGFAVLCDGDTWHGLDSQDVAIVPSLMSSRNLVDYVRYYSLRDLARVTGDAWLIVTLHEYEFGLGDRVDTRSLGDLGETLQQIRAENVAVGVLPLDRSASYIARHGRTLRAKLHWLEQMQRGRGKGRLKCVQFLDQGPWGQGGSPMTDLAACAQWESAVLFAWAKAHLRPLRRFYGKGSGWSDSQRVRAR